MDKLKEKYQLSDKEYEQLIEKINEIDDIKYEDVTFTLYVVPKGTPRARLSRKTNTFYVKGAADNKKFFKKFIREMNWRGIISTQTIFTVKTYHPIPAGMNKIEAILAEEEKLRHISNPDWDNLGKTYSDMIQSLLIMNDNIISDGIVRKYYSFEPRVEVTVSYATKYDSSFNKKLIENRKEFKKFKDDVLVTDHVQTRNIRGRKMIENDS